MARGCRDCSRCTEPGMTGLLMAPVRLTLFVCGGFLVRMLQRRCPQCGHWMGLHARRADGSFKD